MPLAGHLIELRRRLVIAAGALLVGMIVAFLITDPILSFVTSPIHEVAKIRPHALVGFTFNSVTAPFDLRMRLAFSIGIFLSAPVWLWQIWAFIMPGLTKKEIRYTVGFVGAAVPLFFAGCYVGVLVMPHIILLMAGFTPEGADNLYSAQEYYDFIFKLMLVIGVSFIIPVFLVALNFAGIMSGRAILKAWRIAILIACLFAALATPAADVVSMLMLAGILIVLYFAAAGLSLLFDRRKHKRQQEFLEESTV
ncbi:sec-independent protein translocase protein TatC [Microbacterium azadirachtae]|uniref:Sec-independent protein translocase protein TatC n=1 Tax=Microbacterium azadirachtae TaxID=582680 RepID=A0A1I6FWZ4_9MICO|nr:twin-arginine translocase subunit TatC [Microbacterium azadirachtae]SFR34418.1 sec-independent protein translocase protein TatC [Microbacterium azadirachtae]